MFPRVLGLPRWNCEIVEIATVISRTAEFRINKELGVFSLRVSTPQNVIHILPTRLLVVIFTYNAELLIPALSLAPRFNAISHVQYLHIQT